MEGAIFSMGQAKMAPLLPQPLPQRGAALPPAVLHKHRVGGSSGAGGRPSPLTPSPEAQPPPLQGREGDIMAVGLGLSHRPFLRGGVGASCKGHRSLGFG